MGAEEQEKSIEKIRGVAEYFPEYLYHSTQTGAYFNLYIYFAGLSYKHGSWPIRACAYIATVYNGDTLTVELRIVFLIYDLFAFRFSTCSLSMLKSLLLWDPLKLMRQ